MAFDKLIAENIAPAAAAQIGVYDSQGNRVGKVNLGALQTDYTGRLYSFGIVSDVHNCEQSTVASYSQQDMQRAGTWFANNENVEFVACCGDLTENGTAAEFALFQQNKANYFTANNIPFYTCTGNHDCTTAGLNETNWNTYVGDKNFVQTRTWTDEDSVTHNDRFIFFSMTTWNFGSSGTPYSTSDLEWLEQTLDDYRNDRCFVFTHPFFPTAAGNLNDIYPSANWLMGTQLTTLERLRDTYINSHWFSGHSHWKWYTQEYQSIANVYKPTTTGGYTIHIPSLAKPIDSNGSTRVTMLEDAECGVVDVYADHIDVRGVELIDEQYVPIAQYRLPTPVTDMGASKLNVPVGFTVMTEANFTKSTGTDQTITYNSETYELTVTFTAGGQQFRIWDDSWGTVASNSSNTATMYVENVSFNPTISEANQAGLGCYANTLNSHNTHYYLTSGSSGLKINSDGGIEFNCSGSSYNGTFPISITFTNLAFRIDTASE